MKQTILLILIIAVGYMGAFTGQRMCKKIGFKSPHVVLSGNRTGARIKFPQQVEYCHAMTVMTVSPQGFFCREDVPGLTASHWQRYSPFISQYIASPPFDPPRFSVNLLSSKLRYYRDG